MIGVGIVGFGYWGPNYLRVLKQLNEVDYIAVCDTAPEKVALLKNTGVVTYTDFDTFLKDSNLSAVIIATPPQTHYELSKCALLADKHVLVEKPMTLNRQHAKELSELASVRGKKLLVGHIFLYNDGVNFLKEQIDSSVLGKIHEIECVRQGHGPIRSEINVMWDLATHDIAILLHLLGQMPVEVSAFGFKYRENTAQEDSIVVRLMFPNNIQCITKVNWQYPVKERRITVIGEKKMVRFSDTDTATPIIIYDKSVERHGEKSEAEYGAFKMITKDAGCHIPPVKIREPLLLQLQDFLAAFMKNKEPLSGGVSGVNVVTVLDAAQKSLEQGGVSVRVSDANDCENVNIGKGSIVKHVKLGRNSKVWNYCNVYGLPHEPVVIGDNVQVGSFSEIKPNVQIGNNCRLQSHVFIPEMVRIEDNVFIGPGVSFHNDKYPSAVKTLNGAWKCEQTIVKEHASIGGGALIAPGITIGKCAVVGMGSVVVKDVPDYAIVCGNPARIVGDVRDAKYATKYPEFAEGNK